MNSSQAKQQPSVVWESVSKWLPSVSPSRDYWWRLTGPFLAALVSLAGYTTEQQYEALLFYYHWTVSWFLHKEEHTIALSAHVMAVRLNQILDPVYGTCTRSQRFLRMEVHYSE